MSLGGLAWAYPWLLAALPVALLPWFNHNQDKTVAWVDIVPVDPYSKIIGTTLKLITSLVIASLILAVAKPYIPETTVQRAGEGAEIALLLDRSRSMDDPFAVDRPGLYSVATDNSKRRVSRQYLTEFVKKRPDDRFGFVFFSAKAIGLLPLTYSKEAILATINAGALGKGLSDTNMAAALIEAAKMFEGQTYRGSRIVLLVSDGGQQLSDEAKKTITELYRQMNLSIYWIYLRSLKGMKLDASDNDNLLWIDTPERKLHEFFKTLNIPYRAFEAGSLDDFANALDEIDKQHYETLIVDETVPRQQKSRIFIWIAMLGMLVLAASQLITAWGVKKAYE
jgi:mxaC protein